MQRTKRFLAFFLFAQLFARTATGNTLTERVQQALGYNPSFKQRLEYVVCKAGRAVSRVVESVFSVENMQRYALLGQSAVTGIGAYMLYKVGRAALKQLESTNADFFNIVFCTNTTFDDVAGNPEVKQELLEIIDFLRQPKKYAHLGARAPRGVLLTGAPGTGKTLLAKAVAGEAACPFISVTGSEFVDKLIGAGAAHVREIFKAARIASYQAGRPCIVFIDEIDAVGANRNGGAEQAPHIEARQTLNQLLAEMDGFSTDTGRVIVIGATNSAEMLDAALTRPGRFDRIVHVPLPDMASRAAILQVHARKIKFDPAVNLHEIARGTPGFSGAELANLLNEAAFFAARANSNVVTNEHLEEAKDKAKVGLKRPTLERTVEERRMTAYHEAGHALLQILQKDHPRNLHKVTILARGENLGVTWGQPKGDETGFTKEQLIALMVGHLGGYLAEQVIFNTTTEGCSTDVARVKQLASTMVTQYAMSAGPLFDITADPNTLQAELITTAYKIGRELLEANRDALDRVVEALLERETLTGDEVRLLVGEPKMPTNHQSQELPAPGETGATLTTA